MVAAGLGPLYLKAVNDAGFDLVHPIADGWFRAARSGSALAVAVRPLPDQVLLAVPSAAPPRAWGHEPVDMELPPSFTEVAALPDPRSLHRALLQVVALFSNTPEVLSARVESRLAELGPTERTAEVRQRIGQDGYREALMGLSGGRCAVTGIALPALLRASHAKPGKDASDEERLDMHNGLLLAVHLDALFDRGLLWFEGDGQGMLSAAVLPDVRSLLGLTPPSRLKLRWISPQHLNFLSWHKANVCRSDAP